MHVPASIVPTVEMFKGDTRIIVNASDIEAMQADGFTLTQGEPEPQNVVDVSGLTVPQLKEVAKRLNLDGAEKMTKPQLLELLGSQEQEALGKAVVGIGSGF